MGLLGNRVTCCNSPDTLVKSTKVPLGDERIDDYDDDEEEKKTTNINDNKNIDK